MRAPQTRKGMSSAASRKRARNGQGRQGMAVLITDTVEELLDWCEKCRGFLGALAEAKAGAG